MVQFLLPITFSEGYAYLNIFYKVYAFFVEYPIALFCSNQYFLSNLFLLFYIKRVKQLNVFCFSEVVNSNFYLYPTTLWAWLSICTHNSKKIKANLNFCLTSCINLGLYYIFNETRIVILVSKLTGPIEVIIFSAQIMEN